MLYPIGVAYIQALDSRGRNSVHYTQYVVEVHQFCGGWIIHLRPRHAPCALRLSVRPSVCLSVCVSVSPPFCCPSVLLSCNQVMILGMSAAAAATSCWLLRGTRETRPTLSVHTLLHLSSCARTYPNLGSNPQTSIKSPLKLNQANLINSLMTK